MQLVRRPDQTGRTRRERCSVFLHELHKLCGLHKLHKLRKPAQSKSFAGINCAKQEDWSDRKTGIYEMRTCSQMNIYNTTLLSP